MNRRALERHLRLYGCELHHHGKRHDVWLNPLTLAKSPVPRHQTLKRGAAVGICKNLGIPAPPSF